MGNSGGAQACHSFGLVDNDLRRSVAKGSENIDRSTTRSRSCEAQITSEADVDDMLRELEQTASDLMAQYQRVLNHLALDDPAAQRAEEIARKLQLSLKRVLFIKAKTWQGEKEGSEFWTTFTGNQKRFKNLRDAVRQVQVETRIIKRWRKKPSLGIAPSLKYVDLDIESWDKPDVFKIDEECGQPLAQAFMAIYTSRCLDLLCKTSSDQVLKFIRTVEGAYRDNPYHNRKHAADVTLTAYYFYSHLSAQTHLLNYFSEVDLLAIIVAAAAHDVAHPGVNNEFLVKTESELALQYSDRSVLENYHSATAFAIMKETGVSILDHKMVSPPLEALKARVVDMILATDMGRHKQVVDDMASEIRNQRSPQDLDKLILEKHVLHMADIGHPLRPAAQHEQWSLLIREEFLAQGDRERELGFVPGPLFDRFKTPTLAKGQLGFLNFVLMPTWKPLAQILGPSAKPLDVCLNANMAHWDELARRELPPSPCRSRRTTAEF